MAANDIYDVGDAPQSVVTFKNKAGVLTDPTTVIFRLSTPAGVKTLKTFGTGPEITKDSIGIYRITVSLSAEGTWHTRWEGTGALEAAVEDFIIVRDSAFY